MTAVEGAEGSNLSPRESFLEYVIKPVIGNNALLYHAFAQVDRALFVPSNKQGLAYTNSIIELDEEGSSVSEPRLVAEMIYYLGLTGNERVLEIGTGSGYEAAVLAHCTKEVYTVESNERLAAQSEERLVNLGYANIHVICGDGALGYPDQAPYDAIIVSAGTKEIPRALLEQLAENGRIVIPVGEDTYDLDLVVGVKHSGKLETRVVKSVYFHPLVSNNHGGFTQEEVRTSKPSEFRQIELLFDLKRKDENMRTETPPSDEELLKSFRETVEEKIQLAKQGLLTPDQMEFVEGLKDQLNWFERLVAENRTGSSTPRVK